MVWCGGSITMGVLEVIDTNIWEKGRKYLVCVHYKLRPLPVQKCRAWVDVHA